MLIWLWKGRQPPPPKKKKKKKVASESLQEITSLQSVNTLLLKTRGVFFFFF